MYDVVNSRYIVLSQAALDRLTEALGEMNANQIIRRPLVTEKSTIHREDMNILAFEVDRDANKIEVKQAVEELFKVKVEEVRIANVRGKMSRHGPLRRQAAATGARPTSGSRKARRQPEFVEGCNATCR